MKTKITPADITATMDASTFDGTKLGVKTTVLVCTLPSGFEIVASSSCVDPANYDQVLGESICRERIEKKVWELMGYRLQHDLHMQKEAGF